MVYPGKTVTPQGYEIRRDDFIKMGHSPTVAAYLSAGGATLLASGAENDRAERAASQAPTSDLVKQTGTKHTQEFEAAMRWNPDTIIAFPNFHDEFHEKLNTADQRIHAIIVCDPTRTKPWKVAELKAFQDGVVLSAEKLAAGKKVLFLCVNGRNRSRAAAIAAMRLAKLDATALPMPEDETLMQVVECVVARDDAGLAALAPFYPRREKRKR